MCMIDPLDTDIVCCDFSCGCNPLYSDGFPIHIGCVSLASLGVSRCRLLPAGHSVDLDHLAAHTIGALPVYADLAKFQRRGSGEARFAS